MKLKSHLIFTLYTIYGILLKGEPGTGGAYVRELCVCAWCVYAHVPGQQQGRINPLRYSHTHTHAQSLSFTCTIRVSVRIVYTCVEWMRVCLKTWVVWGGQRRRLVLKHSGSAGLLMFRNEDVLLSELDGHGARDPQTPKTQSRLCLYDIALCHCSWLVVKKKKKKRHTSEW